MRFGGRSQFGGSSQFGGAESRAAIYKRLLLDMDPPGMLDTEDGDKWDNATLIDAKALGDKAQALIDGLAYEVFPDTASTLLDKWEELFDIAPSSWATNKERREICTAHWKAQQGTSLPDLRDILSAISTPTHFFRDPCDDADVSYRYETIGPGSESETGSVLTVSIAGSVNGNWDDTTQSPHLLLIDTPDMDDDITVEAEVNAFGVNDDTYGGICIYQDSENAVCCRIRRTSGSLYVDAFGLIDGVTFSGAGQSISLASNQWIRLVRANGVYTLSFGSDYDDLTTVDTLEETSHKIIPRKVGMFCANDLSLNAASIGIDTFWCKQTSAKSNVKIIESYLDEIPATDPETIFFFFVHNDPAYDGSYNIKEQQRLMDKCKPAHTVCHVGESANLKCDSVYDLCDRDILGQ